MKKRTTSFLINTTVAYIQFGINVLLIDVELLNDLRTKCHQMNWNVS